MGLIVPDCPEHRSQGARYLGPGLGVDRCHRGLVLAGIVATVALSARVWGIATELSGFSGEGRYRRTSCGICWGSWQKNSIVMRCRAIPDYHKIRNLVRDCFQCTRSCCNQGL